jgi:hypothetical protein
MKPSFLREVMFVQVKKNSAPALASTTDKRDELDQL